MKNAALGLMILLLAASAAPAQIVSFKLAGGLTRIDGGDYNQGLAGLNRYLSDTSTSLQGTFDPLRNGLHFQTEIINWFFPGFGVGLGGGYYRVSRESTVTGRGEASGVAYDFESTYSAKVSVLPFFLNVHALLHPLPNVGIDIFAGPVFSIVQFNFENPLTISQPSTSLTETFTASQTSLGGQAGVGLAVTLFRGVSLVADACYRFGSVSKLQGNWALRGTSDLGSVNLSSSVYDLWLYQETQMATYSRIGFFDEAGPSGAGLSGAHLADISLSGFSVSAGIKLDF